MTKDTRKKETRSSDNGVLALKKAMVKPNAAKSTKRAAAVCAGPSLVKRNAKVKEEMTAIATDPSPLDEYSSRLHSVVMMQGGKGSDMVG